MIVPSLTFSSVAGTPSLAAAAASRISRASAHANRSAVPLCSTDKLPAVCPSLGVRAVSPWTTSMRASSTSSSSAAICESAVPIPWPSSIFPVKIVTPPFASIASHASSRRLPFRLPGSGGVAPCGRTARGTSRKPIVSAERSRNARRDVMTASPSRHAARPGRCGCARHTGTDGR